MIPLPTGPTLVLTSTHRQYTDFLIKRGVHPAFANGSSNNGGYYEWQGASSIAGLHFHCIVIAGSFLERGDAYKILEYSRCSLEPKGKVVYDNLPTGWYAGRWDTQGDPILHDENCRLRCNHCHAICSETYKGGICSSCKAEGDMTMNTEEWSSNMPKKKPLTKFKLLPLKPGLQSPATMEKLAKLSGGGVVPYLVRKEGDIWKLASVNAPMWTEQWGYQGSAKTPYIVSNKPMSQANGATTEDGWACSCPNFTRHTPRTPCKHILNVRMKEGLVTGKKQAPKASVAALTDADEKAFLEWKRTQAAAKADNKPTAGVKLALFGATTRKFR